MRPHHERCTSFPDACRVRPAPRRRSPWDRILDSFLGEPHPTEPCCTVLEEDLGSEPEGCAPCLFTWTFEEYVDRHPQYKHRLNRDSARVLFEGLVTAASTGGPYAVFEGGFLALRFGYTPACWSREACRLAVLRLVVFDCDDFVVQKLYVHRADAERDLRALGLGLPINEAQLDRLGVKPY